MNNSITSELIATGNSDAWSIDIDEISQNYNILFQVVLIHSRVRVQFTINKLSTIYELANFLSNLNLQSFTIDSCLGGSLNIFLDEGRLCIQQKSIGRFGENELFEVMLNKDEIKGLVIAIKDAIENLDYSG